MSQTTTYLQTKKIIPLPVAVESHALAQEWGRDLWLLINQPSKQKTQLLKITSAQEVEIMAALPMMAASMTICDQQLIATGSNAAGQPLVVGLDATSQVLWEYLFTDLQPITWPVAACGSRPRIAWQQTPEKIEVALLDTTANSLLSKPTIRIQSPPVRIVSWKEKLWGVWTDKDGHHVVDLISAKDRVVSGDGVHHAEFSMGYAKGGVYFGWVTGENANLLLPKTSSLTQMNLSNASGGAFQLISGGAPLIWIQKSEQSIDEITEWKSTLIVPGAAPYSVDGYVFCVAWWRRQVAAVNQSKVILLENKSVRNAQNRSN